MYRYHVIHWLEINPLHAVFLHHVFTPVRNFEYVVLFLDKLCVVHWYLRTGRGCRKYYLAATVTTEFVMLLGGAFWRGVSSNMWEHKLLLWFQGNIGHDISRSPCDLDYLWLYAASSTQYTICMPFGDSEAYDISMVTIVPRQQWSTIDYLLNECDELNPVLNTKTPGHGDISTFMMTSSNGNIFRVTGPLCGEFTGPGEFPTQRPVMRSFDVFFDLRLNKRLSKQPWGWWFEAPSWSLWRQCNAWPLQRELNGPRWIS